MVFLESEDGNALQKRGKCLSSQFNFPVTIMLLLNVGNLSFLHVTWVWPVEIIIYYLSGRYLGKKMVVTTNPKLKEIFLYMQSSKSKLLDLPSSSYYQTPTLILFQLRGLSCCVLNPPSMPHIRSLAWALVSARSQVSTWRAPCSLQIWLQCASTRDISVLLSCKYSNLPVLLTPDPIYFYFIDIFILLTFSPQLEHKLCEGRYLLL